MNGESFKRFTFYHLPLTQCRQSRVVIGLLLDLRHELRMQHLVVLVEHDHAARGEAFESAVRDIDAVFRMEFPVADRLECDDVVDAFGRA